METSKTETQADKMKAEPQKEHRWLEKLVGKWTSEAEATMEPGKPPEKFTGTETVRSLGGLWFLAEGRGEMPGGEKGTTVMTLGYDPQKKRYVGTFVASMMTHMWLYEGKVDEAGRTLTLDTEGPSMAGDGTMSKYQDSMKFESDDHRVLTSQMLGPDGKWQKIMSIHYRRAK
jgi:Protein of unknown function (DUF1579)